jgi:hypothetical protein
MLRGYLQDCVVPVLWKQRALVIVAISKSKARHHACGIVDCGVVGMLVVEPARRPKLKLGVAIMTMIGAGAPPARRRHWR